MLLLPYRMTRIFNLEEEIAAAQALAYDDENLKMRRCHVRAVHHFAVAHSLTHKTN